MAKESKILHLEFEVTANSCHNNCNNKIMLALVHSVWEEPSSRVWLRKAGIPCLLGRFISIEMGSVVCCQT